MVQQIPGNPHIMKDIIRELNRISVNKLYNAGMNTTAL